VSNEPRHYSDKPHPGAGASRLRIAGRAGIYHAVGVRMKPSKTSTKHPYAAIEHRVIDSLAYADLSFSARALLVIITRQLSKNNNGKLQATFSWCSKYGFAERTLIRAIQELISHGFIYRTRAGGYQQGAAQYAVTWLSVTSKEGLFLAGFVPCAWRDWKPEEKNLPPAKVQLDPCKNGIRTASTPAKNAARGTAKSADNEYVPIEGSLSTHPAHRESARATASIHRFPQVASGRMEPIKHYA